VQAKKLQAEELAKQKPINLPPIETQSTLVNPAQPEADKPLMSAATEEPTTASLELDDMFNDLGHPSPHESQQDQMDIDIGTFDPNDVSSLLPGLEAYANMTSAPLETATTITTDSPPNPDPKLNENRKESVVDDHDLLAGGDLDLNDPTFDELFNFPDADFSTEEQKDTSTDLDMLEF